jgi:hypothetical protein
MNTRKWLVICTAVLALLLASVVLVQAQTGGGYDLTWNSIDGGGQMNLSGGSYTLKGTIGQPDAGNHTGGGYSLGGGFWISQMRGIYIPIITK